MIELPAVIPDYRLLLELTPEELAAKMLFILKKRKLEIFHTRNLQNELWHQYSVHQANVPPQYPRVHQQKIDNAIDEAWAWLHAQCLVIPTPGGPGIRLSRRATSMESEAEFADFNTARLLSREILNPKIADSVWRAFMRGEFDVAVFLAMKAVEVSVREASGLGNDAVGVRLMRLAFHPNDGPLTDMSEEAGEREGRMNLFAGAIGSYKNPQSHRDVNLNYPAEAIEVIFLANHLLRLVDARVTAESSLSPPS